jgi:hypothetical protein
MTGDCHVRFCEGLEVKFPRATRLDQENLPDPPPKPKVLEIYDRLLGLPVSFL